MIAVDTNVVVRLLTQDDELQFNKNERMFALKTPLKRYAITLQNM